MAASGPPLPLRTRLLMAAITYLIDAVRRRDGTVNRRLLALLDRKTPPNPTPVDGVATSDHTVDASRNLWLRLFSPPSSFSREHPSLPLIVYFHGGGFVLHSAATGAYDALCRRLARCVPAIVASVDYRLAPEHRYPAAYEDGIDVLRWLRDCDDLVPDFSGVFLAGDSAGGNIAHHVARRAARGEEQGRAAVMGLVVLQPFFGGAEASPSEKRMDGVPMGRVDQFEWMWSAYLPEGAGRDHEAANVFGPGSATSSEEWGEGFPATMVCIGGWDPLQDRQRWYSEGLRKKGVEASVAEYSGGTHGFYAFPELPDAHKLMDDIADFVRRRIEGLRRTVDK